MLIVEKVLIRETILANTTAGDIRRKIMGKIRALFTETEHKQLTGEKGDERNIRLHPEFDGELRKN